MRFASSSTMAPKKRSSRKRANVRPAHPRASETRPRDSREEEREGPPTREATLMRSDREREEAERLAKLLPANPELTGGDVDADWQRADSGGEEAVGGSVATPDQDVVDELGDALGVPRAPDEPVRSSQEILEQRDRNRWKYER